MRNFSTYHDMTLFLLIQYEAVYLLHCFVSRFLLQLPPAKAGGLLGYALKGLLLWTSRPYNLFFCS